MKVTLNLQGVLGFLSAFKDQEGTYADFTGDTIGDVLNHILSKMKSTEKHMLVDEQGEPSPELLVFLNGNPLYDSNRMEQPLREGDVIELSVSSG